VPSVMERFDNWYGKLRATPSPAFTVAEPLLFLHVHKTGGTTLVNQIEAACGVRETQGVYSGKGRLRDRVKRYQTEASVTPGRRVYYGHMYYGVHKALGVPPTYATFLREPFSRAWSHHEHANRARSADGLAPLSVEGFVDAGDTYLDNLQTRLISGFRSVPFGELTPNHLSIAKANLETFVFAGILERSAESLLLFSSLLQTEISMDWQLNVAPKRPGRSAPSSAEAEVIGCHNQFDAALYSFASGLLDQRIESLKADSGTPEPSA
jgi:hypothetical protein